MKKNPVKGKGPKKGGVLSILIGKTPSPIPGIAKAMKSKAPMPKMPMPKKGK